MILSSIDWIPQLPAEAVAAASAAPRLTVFLIDGMQGAVYDELMAQGKMPSVAALRTRGCTLHAGAASFPTITGYGYWSLLTGLEATRSGLLGTRFFDRKRTSGNWRNYYGPAGKLLDGDFESAPATLFEAGAELGGWTLAANSFLERGATVRFKTSQEMQFAKVQHVWWKAKLLRWLGGPSVSPTLLEVEGSFLRRVKAILAQAPTPPKVHG